MLTGAVAAAVSALSLFIFIFHFHFHSLSLLLSSPLPASSPTPSPSPPSPPSPPPPTLPSSSLSAAFHLSSGYSFACAGDLLSASSSFSLALSLSSSSPSSSSSPPSSVSLSEEAAAYHSLGNVAAVQADWVLAAACHARALRADPSSVPPLALRHQAGEPCNNIGAVYWSSSFSKAEAHGIISPHVDLLAFSLVSQVSQVSFPSSSSLPPLPPLSSLLPSLSPSSIAALLASHISLGSQLEHAGLLSSSTLHFSAAEALALYSTPSDLSLRVRNALMVPVSYGSLEAVALARASLVSKVSSLHSLVTSPSFPSPPNSLPPGPTELGALSELNMPGTFYVVYQGFDDRDVMVKIRECYYSLYPKVTNHKGFPPPSRSVRVPSSSPAPPARLRIGFVSSHLRDHSVCKLFCGIITSLDPDRFEVHVFSGTSQPDSATASLAASLSKHPTPAGGSPSRLHSLAGFNLRNRNAAASLHLDVLVYLDVGMDTGSDMWAHARMAPVQMAMWGHPTTTGLKDMDYFVSSDLFHRADNRADKVVSTKLSSESSPHESYSEQLLLLSSPTFHFPHPSHIPSTVSSLGSYPRSLLSPSNPVLPSDVLYLVPQSLQKFHPAFDEAIRGVLEASPDHRVVIVYDEQKPLWKAQLAARFENSLGSSSSGSSSSSRVVFVPTLTPSDFFRLISASDVLLDPYPFGGGVTTLEAFSLCKPVVTCPGMQTVPQLTAGMYRAMGGGRGGEVTGEMVAKTVKEYVEVAVRLGGDGEFRRRVGEEICELSVERVYGGAGSGEEFGGVVERVVKGREGG